MRNRKHRRLVTSFSAAYTPHDLLSQLLLNHMVIRVRAVDFCNCFSPAWLSNRWHPTAWGCFVLRSFKCCRSELSEASQVGLLQRKNVSARCQDGGGFVLAGSVRSDSE